MKTASKPGVNTISAAVRQMREALRLEQSDLAMSLGVLPNTVHRWESGRMPDALSLLKLRRYAAAKGLEKFATQFAAKLEQLIVA